MIRRIKKLILEHAVVFGVAMFLLVAAGIGYSQNEFSTLYDVMFRVINPTIRAVGTISFTDRTGTTNVTTLTPAGGGFAISGAMKPTTVGTTATYTLGASSCGGVYEATLGSSTQTYTLPAVTQAGCEITFVTGNAAGEIHIVPAESGTTHIIITTFTAIGASPGTGITNVTAPTGIKSTRATNAVANICTLVSDGVATWYSKSMCTGIWATE